MFGKMKEMLKGKDVKLVFTEGEDPRILTAAAKLRDDKLLIPVLLGDTDKINQVASELSLSLDGIELIDPATYADFDKLVDELVAIRKGKMTKEQAEASLKQGNYFGTMLVKTGVVAGLLGGATYSTADTVRPALQIIKTKPGNKIVSSFFVLARQVDGKDEAYAVGDCAINIDPSADDLVEIATETAKAARLFDIDPKVALLSYSSYGSGKGESVDKMRTATETLKGMDLDFPVDGELQFDAAFVPEVGKLKAPTSKVAGQANTFIMPDINAGNISYKMAQRFGGFEAIGPILLGLNAPINDLSRGTTTQEVYTMAIVTAASAL
ncbi:MAG: phosphate acetyltransferase [Clostridiales Family XIII bacterium]|jgi:phosphate acetyltransferase|nr:phosphate acetyltransferase [Clostridiales Family XIII bacterium]